SLGVKWAESGEVLRFTYRVLDASKAKALNDKKNEPVLIDPQAGVKLVVPSMENVGQLRQSAPPEEGKSYWMVFSNKGRLVKRGDHVSPARRGRQRPTGRACGRRGGGEGDSGAAGATALQARDEAPAQVAPGDRLCRQDRRAGLPRAAGVATAALPRS